MGGQHPGGGRGDGRGASAEATIGASLTTQFDSLFRDHWWPAVAVVARQVGDLEAAEDAVQEACAAALAQWPRSGVPASPRSWLVSVARNKALDHVRREARRPAKEAAAALEASDDQVGVCTPEEADVPEATAEDQLGLIFMCCHPALAAAAQTALTLRLVCGLSTAEIAAAFLVPEPTMAQRLVRAKRKIRQAGIVMRVPAKADLPDRLAAVLRVIYLVFTEGHLASSGRELVRGDLCERAIRLARDLAGLLPGEPEADGLLALLLLTDARRAARTGPGGELIQLADQDRGRWDAARIAEGRALVERALAAGRPGAYQLQAAIAAVHSEAGTSDATDWAQIVALYNELMRFEPTPVTAANRAAAIAMVDGPDAGLRILAQLAGQPAVAGWPALHVAMAELHRLTGALDQAVSEYRVALELGVSEPQHRFIASRIRELRRG